MPIELLKFDICGLFAVEADLWIMNIDCVEKSDLLKLPIISN